MCAYLAAVVADELELSKTRVVMFLDAYLGVSSGRLIICALPAQISYRGFNSTLKLLIFERIVVLP